jgi:hypothetical protein
VETYNIKERAFSRCLSSNYNKTLYEDITYFSGGET